MGQDAGKRLQKYTLLGRSALYRWIDAHYSQLAPVIDIQAHPSWTALVKTVQESAPGEFDGLSRQLVAKTFMRVKADRARAEKIAWINQAVPKPHSTPAVTATPAPVRLPQPQPSPVVSPSDDPLSDIRRQMNQRSGRSE